MPANGDTISHLCKMVHMKADLVHFEMMGDTGLIHRLRQQIAQGGFVTNETVEAMMLRNSSKYLREAADAVEACMLDLIQNDVAVQQ